MTDLSIVLATHNGEAVLGMTLRSLANQDFSGIDHEIIVIDNNSTDLSNAIAHGFATELPLSVITESKRGRCNASQAGVERSRGDLIVFIDDDVLPEPGWVRAYCDAAANHPEASLFAGQVRHHWMKPPPKWLERLAAEGMSYGGTRSTLQAGIVGPEIVKGANFAVRREVAMKQAFRSDLVMGGEDTDYAQRAALAGHQIRFVPEACLKHLVRHDQVNVPAVLKRYFRIGRTSALIQPSVYPAGVSTFFGFPRYAARRVLVGGLAALARFPVSRYASMKHLIPLAAEAGRAYQWRLGVKSSPDN